MRVQILIWTFVLMFSAVLSDIEPAFAQTENRYDPYGAQGDAGADLRCPGGSYVVGMTGGIGSNLDRIQLSCAKLGPDGVALAADSTSVTVGGPGGAPTTANCGSNTYVVEFAVWLTLEKKQVEAVFANCKNSKGASTLDFGTEVSFDASASAYLFGPSPRSRTFKCLPNMAVTGLTVRYGQHVNAIGAICATIVVPPGPPPPPPGPPHHTGTVVNFGVPKDGSPRPVVIYPSFAGRWLVTTRTGGTFTLLLNAGDGNDLFGTYTGTDPKNNGTVAGQVSGGRDLHFTYKETATGKTGTGKLMYRGENSNSFLGGINSDDTPSEGVFWAGTRQ